MSTAIGTHDAPDWAELRRRLLPAAEVREVCGFSQRHTFIRWRHDKRNPFPPPVLTFPGRGAELELWDRVAVELWLQATAGRRQPR